jgi:hypothetical protein
VVAAWCDARGLCSRKLTITCLDTYIFFCRCLMDDCCKRSKCWKIWIWFYNISMNKTLLVLGAGASKDFCSIFMTGAELIKEINYHFLTEKKYPLVKEIDGVFLSAMMNDIVRVFGPDIELLNKIKNQVWDIQLHYEFENLRDRTEAPISIDYFVSSQIQNGLLEKEAGNIIKYCIIYLIKGLEQAISEGKHKIGDSWIKLLADEAAKHDLQTIQDNLSIITFNYDRLFEECFLRFMCKQFPNINVADLENFINRITQHVYGSLGSLQEIPFCLPNDQYWKLKYIVPKINLVDDDERNINPIVVSDASTYNKIHFLGFGYDKTNIKKLNLDQFTKAFMSGTGFNLSEEQIKSLKNNYGIEVISTRQNKPCFDYCQGNLTL